MEAEEKVSEELSVQNSMRHGRTAFRRENLAKPSLTPPPADGANMVGQTFCWYRRWLSDFPFNTAALTSPQHFVHEAPPTTRIGISEALGGYWGKGMVRKDPP